MHQITLYRNGSSMRIPVMRPNGKIQCWHIPYYFFQTICEKLGGDDGITADEPLAVERNGRVFVEITTKL